MKIPKVKFPVEKEFEVGEEISLRSFEYPAEGQKVANLLYIHGYGENCQMNAHFFKKFAESNIHTYCFDRRGFGLSQGPNIIPGELSESAGLLTDVETYIAEQI